MMSGFALNVHDMHAGQLLCAVPGAGVGCAVDAGSGTTAPGEKEQSAVPLIAKGYANGLTLQTQHVDTLKLPIVAGALMLFAFMKFAKPPNAK